MQRPWGAAAMTLPNPLLLRTGPYPDPMSNEVRVIRTLGLSHQWRIARKRSVSLKSKLHTRLLKKLAAHISISTSSPLTRTV